MMIYYLVLHHVIVKYISCRIYFAHWVRGPLTLFGDLSPMIPSELNLMKFNAFSSEGNSILVLLQSRQNTLFLLVSLKSIKCFFP